MTANIAEVPVSVLALIMTLILFAFVMRYMKRKAEADYAAFCALGGDAAVTFKFVSRVLSDERTPAGARRALLLLLAIMQSGRATRAFIQFDDVNESADSDVRKELEALHRDAPDLYDDLRGAMVGIFVMMATSHLASPISVAAVVRKTTMRDPVEALTARTSSAGVGSFDIRSAVPA